MPKFETYLFFNGNCAEAMRYYEKRWAENST
jgi:uncharacterized glyoxalase superfamily protein PhnB